MASYYDILVKLKTTAMQSLQMLPDEIAQHLSNASIFAGYLWGKGWAERNAGNISINLSNYSSALGSMKVEKTIACSLPAEAANMILFITGKGCRLRDLKDRVEHASCILKINRMSNAYSIIWGGKAPNFLPTSELIAHVNIQLANEKINPDHRVVLHTHPDELIVLSHHPMFANEALFNHSLWKMCPEVKLFNPGGVACVPYRITGSDDLAKATISRLNTCNVILWEKHGVLATASNIEEAFDLIDVANKGARLLLMAWQSGFDPIGLTEEELSNLEKLI